MNNNSSFKNIMSVAFSNCTTVVSGIIVGFFIPKIMTIEGYGYYKTFSLYTTYLGFFSLGVIDGIVLEHGGKNYDELDRPLFRGSFRWYIIIHGFSFVAMFVLSLLQKSDTYRFITLALAFNMIGLNITGYYRQISQITQRFKEYSARKILQSILSISIVLILIILYKTTQREISHQLYIISIVLMNLGLATWYLFTYKDLVIGKSYSLRETRTTVYSYFLNGMPLLISNLCSTLLLTLDRQFVNILFSVKQYAIYSFAYNMLSLVTVATSAVSTVLYPAMKRSSKEELINQYEQNVSILLVFVFGMLIAYYPLNWFVGWFLPKYKLSIPIFRIIFPGLAMSSVVSVIIHNYYKVFGLNLLFFKMSIAALIVSAAANLLAFYMFGTMASISAASIVTMCLWYLFAENIMVRNYGIHRWKNMAFLFCMISFFYLTTYINNMIFGFVLYVGLFIIVSISFYKTLLLRFIKRQLY